jgi:adenylosuccinate synthase
MEAKIVLGLGFGDEGKGITTDYLCSKSIKPIVIRFSGGQQAGHTVMIGDKKHIHSNYGSGTLRGVPSYFSEHCSIYLPTLWAETKKLNDIGITPQLYVHPLTKVTTPFDVVFNRMTEKKNQHGSCGLGIAATMKRHNESGHKLFAIDLQNKLILEQKLDNMVTYYSKQAALNNLNVSEFLSESMNRLKDFIWILENEYLFDTINYSLLEKYKTLIFEGSQGIMLDMDHGIFPNVTYANTTSKNAIEICNKLDIKNIETYYITRCYQTRHGNGWMSNQNKIELINNENEINIHNEYQGHFKIGELDYELLDYAVSIDKGYNLKSTKNLVVTCLDQRPNFEFNPTKLKNKFHKLYKFSSPKTGENTLWEYQNMKMMSMF